MTDHDKKSQINPGKLGVAILEHFIEPLLGKDAIAEVKGSYYENELRHTLSQTLVRTENRIIASYPDKEITSALLGLPLATLPSIAQAVRDFIDHPNSSELQNLICKKLSDDYPKFTQDQISTIADEYARTLKEELVTTVPEVRQKIQALSDLSMDNNIKNILDRLDRLIQSKEASNADQERYFDDYVDKMQDLIIKQGLQEKSEKSAKSPEVLLAISRTEAVLKKLSGPKKSKVVHFLKQQGLLNNTAQYLVGVDLKNADLQGASLQEVNFSSSDLSGSVLEGANLYKSTFLRSILVNASLQKAKLESSELFEANLQKATLDQADLSNANLSSIDAEKASFSDAIMDKCNLTEARLKNAKLVNANLHDADLLHADLSGADLTGCDLSGAILDQSTFSGALITPEQIQKAGSSWGIINSDGSKDLSRVPIRRKPLIITVEDDSDISLMLSIYFRDQGYSVIPQYWGGDAIECIRQYLPDLVILDIRLPDIDGYEIARRIRMTKRIMQIPFIFLTQKDERSDKLVGLELGADAYLTKPFDIQELKLVVKMALLRKQRVAMINPVTGLPEKDIVDELISESLEKSDWAILVVSITNIDDYRGLYGFIAADDVLRAVSSIIQNSTSKHGNTSDHVGHLTTAELLIVTTVDKVENLSNKIKEEIDQSLPAFYTTIARNKPAETNLERIRIKLASIRYGDQKFENIDQLKTELWRKIKAQRTQ